MFMLSFRRLVIEDFGPYRGRQTVEFPRERGVYIVSGPNGRGKTKLHNAFRWALYGKILSRAGAQGAREMVNSEARIESGGVGSFSTILEFVHSGIDYRLTRRYDERMQPNVSVLLERNDIPLNQVDADKVLRQIAPDSVSQFFLFDGELLRQYESLLDADSDQGKKLEVDIERVLGIPIVSNALVDAEESRAQASRRIAEQASANANTQHLGAALQEAGDIRAQLVRDRAVAKKSLEQTEARILEVEEALGAQPRAERLIGQVNQLRQQKSDLEMQENSTRQGLADLSGELWMAVLVAPARARQGAVQAETERLGLQLREASAAIRDREHLEHHTNCPVCERQLDEAERTSILGRVTTDASVERREQLEAEWARLRGHSEALTNIAGYDGRLVRERDQALRKVRLDLNTVAEEISLLESQLRDVNQEEIRALSRERDERNLEVARQQKRIGEVSDHIIKQDGRISDLTDNLARLNFKPDPAVKLKQRITHELVGLFQQSIAVYRRQLRDRVESAASEVFAALSSEPDYASLKITDRYGLEIIDKHGAVVTGRSAGYEHLVALSLIAALQGSAAVRGPVVMDSPFGRLDEGHTDRVVAALPRMADQVVLLAFDSEFDRSAALRDLGTDLVAEFELERISHRNTKIKLREES
ncbi:AAA family ATPase [Streptomyces sp. NPDC088190]|uniref:AAA family ATPase n=1 Tax=unclassified Streptomyces TaxID=2593676 RepID=UPI00340E74B3